MTMGSPKFQLASRSNCFVVWDVSSDRIFSFSLGGPYPRNYSISSVRWCIVPSSSLLSRSRLIISSPSPALTSLIGLCTSLSSVLTFCLHRRWQGIWIVPVALLLLFGLLGRVLYLLLLSQFAVIRHPNGAIITAWAHVFELSPSTEKEPRSRLFVMAYYLWGKVRCSSRRTIHQGLIAPRRQWMGQPMLVVWSLPISNV